MKSRRALAARSATPRVLSSTIFKESEGILWDFSNTDSMYQDATGVTGIGVIGNSIGLVSDLAKTRGSVSSYGGAQASSALRPVYGRAPKSRRNLLTNTETFIGAVNMVTTVVPDGTLLVPTSGFTDCRTHNNYTSREFGFPVAVSVSARAAGARYIHVGRAGAGVWFDLVAGTIPFSGAGMTATIGPVGEDGLRRLCVIFSNEVIAKGTATQARLYVSVGAPTSIASTSGSGNNSVDGVIVNYLQLEQGVATAYQKVTSALDFSEAGSAIYGFARFDGVDDRLTLSLPSPIVGDLMLFGRSGSWLEAGATIPSGAYSIGPTGTTLTLGVLRVIGDLVGVVIIGRSTTAAERATILRYFTTRGAAGWLVAGEERLVNGGFDSDTGWIKLQTAPATAMIAGGKLTLVSPAGEVCNARQDVLIIGQLYQVTGSLTVRSGNAKIVAGGLEFYFTTTRTFSIVAEATAVAFYLSRTTACDVDFDNVSVKPLVVAA